MPEDEPERGERANKRIIAVLGELGWIQQGKENVDIPCSSGIHSDRQNDHGVDAYFQYKDPFRELERGVFVESKIRNWESVNRTSLRNFMTQTLGTIECAPESDVFEQRLNFGVPRNHNAGVISVWAPDDYYDEDFVSYVSDVGIHRKERGTYEIAILGNKKLNRLARTSKQFSDLKNEFDHEATKIYFYYPSMLDKPFPDKTESLALESIVSDLIFAKVEKPRTIDGEVTGHEEILVVFHYGDMTVEALEVVFQSLVLYNLLNVNEVRIYHDPDVDRDMQDIDAAKRQFRNNIVPDDEENPNFNFYVLPSVQYDNYADRLIGGNQ
ncbi:hypothetical protein [Salinigranum halophilum]|uniref:hypothetical protein n=1 Tax=Salinigranum halophilum TaxID=2565931 RepID=UPI00115D22F7|nr:hypothetical protein [Salinigranum halophilum]